MYSESDGTDASSSSQAHLHESLPGTLRFGEFELDRAAAELRREGQPVQLGGQPMALLELLASRAGKLVERDAIKRHLWGDDVYVEFDQGINAAVRQLRQALADDASAPRFIVTVPRRGYRFVAAVKEVPASIGTSTSPPLESPRPRSRARVPVLWLMALTLGFSVVLLGSHNGEETQAISGSGHPPRLAILPLRPLGTAESEEYLAEGLTEELITRLTARSGRMLDVVASTSSVRLGDDGDRVGRAARELGADYVLLGTLQRRGNHVRVGVRLVRTASATSRWSGSYDRDLRDVLALERELAERIATALDLQLRQASVGEKSVTASREGYEAYLRGRSLLRTPGGDPTRARRLLRLSVEEEPGYAPAWVELARAWRRSAVPRASRAPAGAALARALSLDDESASAHLLLGLIHFYGDLDPEAARHELRRALDLCPACADAHDAYAGWLSQAGRHREALAEVERALALDPLSPMVRSDVAWYLYFGRRWQEAAKVARRTLDRDPGFEWAQEVLILSLVASGDLSRAADTAMARMRDASRQGPASKALSVERRAAASAVAAGHPKMALDAYWRWQLSAATHNERPATSLARLADLYLLLGRTDAALDALEQAYQHRSGWTLPFLRVHPLYDRLRNNPRFQALLRHIASHAGTTIGVIGPPNEQAGDRYRRAAAPLDRWPVVRSSRLSPAFLHGPGHAAVR